jgi:quinol monooxygenase YgiN
MSVLVYYDVIVKPGRMADFLAKEPVGHAIAHRLGVDGASIARDVDDDHHVLVSFSFADRQAYDAFMQRAATDPEAIEYNAKAVSPDNPTKILGVRLVETFEL